MVHEAVYSFRKEEAESFAAKHQVKKIYTDLDELGRSDVDFVYIANPNALHYPTSKSSWNMGSMSYVKKPQLLLRNSLKDFIKLQMRTMLFFWKQ